MVALSPYAFLEPSVWRSLLARAAVFHATRRMLGNLCDLAERVRAVEMVLDQLQLRAQEVSEEDDDATAVAQVVTAWDGDLSRVLELRRVEADVLRLLAEVRAALEHACGGDPFQAMFRAVEREARALYGSAWRPAVLSLAHIRSHPREGHPATDPYGLTATTAWSQRAGQDEALVELQIYGERFGPAAYAAVPMLLTHECVCHVPARQDRVRNDSAFAEGLLDWAAYHFLSLWAVKLDRELGPTARKHAERLKSVLTGRSTTREGAARRVGHDAAGNLAAWFESECEMSAEESFHRVARLAVELNMVDRSLAAKENLVSLLSSPPPKLEQDLHSWVLGTMTTEQLLDAAGTDTT
ncbi:MAG: hypothetical protein E6F99_08185 [Actinobacteria bacterium]|nr:MAG: hypothetical protein E6F99_08185 [Actinomycetota bacterium]